MTQIKKSDASKPQINRGKVTVTKDGPYIVTGGIPLAKEIIGTDASGIPVKWVKGARYPDREKYSLCRCGQSESMPYCDGKHQETGFDGTETAGDETYMDQADTLTGPDLILTDAEALCAIARFCDRAGGVWNLTDDSDDPKSKRTAIQEAGDCPAGRLVTWDISTEKPLEPRFEPSISLVEDPEQKASGPLWIKGGVPIVSADGTPYEIRNRVTLCRCGESENKPFCDGSHLSSGFDDGDASLTDKAGGA
jgi:CDGSH-type Zn-finger protein